MITAGDRGVRRRSIIRDPFSERIFLPLKFASFGLFGRKLRAHDLRVRKSDLPKVSLFLQPDLLQHYDETPVRPNTIKRRIKLYLRQPGGAFLDGAFEPLQRLRVLSGG